MAEKAAVAPRHAKQIAIAGRISGYFFSIRNK